MALWHGAHNCERANDPAILYMNYTDKFRG